MPQNSVYIVHDQPVSDAKFYGVYDNFKDAVAKSEEEAKKTWCAIPVLKCEINTNNYQIVHWSGCDYDSLVS